jgi:hypothetical protein
VSKYCSLLRDFPIQGLLAASDWDEMGRAVEAIFAHLKNLKRIVEYPLPRAIELIHGTLHCLTRHQVAICHQSFFPLTLYPPIPLLLLFSLRGRECVQRYRAASLSTFAPRCTRTA